MVMFPVGVCCCGNEIKEALGGSGMWIPERKNAWEGNAQVEK